MLTLATILAEETAKLVNDTGQVIIVASDASPLKGGVVGQLEQSLKKQGPSLNVITERIKLPLPNGPEDVGLPADELNRILQKYPDATVIVSLVGLPVLKRQDLSQSRQKLPKLVVYSPMPVGIKSLLEQGVIQVVVIPGGSSVAQGQAVGTPGSFGARYQVITPDMIPSIPPEPPMPPSIRK
jgi:hypothetical protein